MPDPVSSPDDKDQEAVEAEKTLDANTEAEVSSTPAEDGGETAEDAKKPDEPKSLLEAVIQATEGEGEEGGDTSDPKADEGDDAGKADDADDPDNAAKDGKEDGEDDDESKPPPFHKHPRWKKLVAERDDLKTKVEEAAPLVEQVTALRGYLTENAIKPESFKWAVSLMGQVSRNPAAALPEVRKLLSFVEERAGAVLPADLQKKVDDGQVDAETARELSMARQGATLAEANRGSDDQRAAIEADATFRSEAAAAVSNWEKQWAASDPDYEVKKDRVADKLRLALSNPETFPKSLAEVGTLVKGIREQVENEMKGLLRQRKPMKSTRGGSASGTKSEPKSLIEAMEQAVS